MKNFKIYDNSKNYTCQVIKLPNKVAVPGLDNLVRVNVQGNDCLISRDSNPDELYLFFPSECQIAEWFLSDNNLYRHNDKNFDKTQAGFFEDNGRVKAVKFKGVISSGFVIPIQSLHSRIKTTEDLPQLGDEFNEIAGTEVCKKYVRKFREGKSMSSSPKERILDQIVDSKMAPEHMDTAHLMRNLGQIRLDDTIAVTYKLHGTSARYFNTLTKKKLNWKERVAKWFGVPVVEETFNLVCGSRRVIKSVGLEALPEKNHFFKSGDLWSEVGKEFFEGRLHTGEAVYCEIIGKTYSGEAIQNGYSYGFERPKVYIYRISMINSRGIEIDLSYTQMLERAEELGVPACPSYFYGRVSEFLPQIRDDRDKEEGFNTKFYGELLEKPSIFDASVAEEGFCVRIDKYPRPLIFKIKSKAFLIHEGIINDKELKDIEEEQV
jgi:hypothetical protein